MVYSVLVAWKEGELENEIKKNELKEVKMFNYCFREMGKVVNFKAFHLLPLLKITSNLHIHDRYCNLCYLHSDEYSKLCFIKSFCLLFLSISLLKKKKIEIATTFLKRYIDITKRFHHRLRTILPQIRYLVTLH